MREVIWCALARRATPATAGDLTDDAIALMQAEGWPRWARAGMTVKSVSRLLQGAAKRSEVREMGRRNEGGVLRPLYAALAPDANAPMPTLPDPEGEDHPLAGKTKRQQFVLFDAMDRFMDAHIRMRQESNDLQAAQRRTADDMWLRHAREIAALADRVRRDLLAAGIDIEVTP